MPIDLTTTWKAGSVDDMAEYGEAEVVSFRIGLEKNKRIDILVDTGDTLDGAWVPGATGQVIVKLDDTAEEGETSDYRAFVQANSALLRGLRRALYEVVQAKCPKLAGTVT